MLKHMVYLFASPRCSAPQSLSVSCNKFGKSWVHIKTWLTWKPVKGLEMQSPYKLTISRNQLTKTPIKEQINKASLLFETLEPDKPNNSSIPFSRVILHAVKA